MKPEDIDELLVLATSRGEAVLYTPPDGFELVPIPADGAPIVGYEVDGLATGDVAG